MTSNSETKYSNTAKDRRVEDQLKLRELELQTNFQIQTLSESLNLLKKDFHMWRDSVNEKIEVVRAQTSKLNNRLNIIIALALAQIVDAPAILIRLIGA